MQNSKWYDLRRIKIGNAALIGLGLIAIGLMGSGVPGSAFAQVVGPDLVVTAVSGPSEAAEGTYADFSMTVRNQGTGIAGTFLSRVQLCTNSNGTGCNAGLVAWWVTSLGAGQSQTLTYNSLWLHDIVPGTYYLVGVADVNNEVVETNETNNSFVGSTIAITIPDLVMTQLSGPASEQTGDSIILTNTVLNQGNGRTPDFPDPNVLIQFYLSTDAVITRDDRFLGSRIVSGLLSGQSSTAQTPIILPTDIAAGRYYFGAIVDPGVTIPESNEGNNILTGNAIDISISTAARPDLVVTSVKGPNTGKRRDVISITSSLLNQGTAGTGAPFTLTVYISPDAVIDPLYDLVIGSGPVAPMAMGESRSVTLSGPIPALIVPGTYYLGAVVDSGNVIVEINDINNAKTGNSIKIR